jgi:hypothetical protein
MLDETLDCRTASSLFEQNPSDMGLGMKNPMKKVSFPHIIHP